MDCHWWRQRTSQGEFVHPLSLFDRQSTNSGHIATVAQVLKLEDLARGPASLRASGAAGKMAMNQNLEGHQGNVQVRLLECQNLL